MTKYVAKHCLFCKDSENLKLLYQRNFNDQDLTPEIFSARRMTEHFHYETVLCQNCGLVFAREILSPEDLSRLYRESRVNYDDLCKIISEDYWRQLKTFMPLINMGTALEIGCGNGFFLDRLVTAGFAEVVGCEPSQSAKLSAPPSVRDKIQTKMFSPQLYPERSFDLVCCFQTLDHLSDPIEVVNGVYKIVKPGGFVYFIVHDVDGLQAKLLKDRSPIIDVEHVYLFNRNTLRRLFSSAGFSVVEVKDAVSTYPLSYWVRMLGFNKLAFWLNRVWLGRIRFPIKSGNLFIIAKR